MLRPYVCIIPNKLAWFGSKTISVQKLQRHQLFRIVLALFLHALIATYASMRGALLSTWHQKQQLHCEAARQWRGETVKLLFKTKAIKRLPEQCFQLCQSNPKSIHTTINMIGGPDEWVIWWSSEGQWEKPEDSSRSGTAWKAAQAERQHRLDLQCGIRRSHDPRSPRRSPGFVWDTAGIALKLAPDPKARATPEPFPKGVMGTEWAFKSISDDKHIL